MPELDPAWLETPWVLFLAPTQVAQPLGRKYKSLFTPSGCTLTGQPIDNRAGQNDLLADPWPDRTARKTIYFWFEPFSNWGENSPEIRIPEIRRPSPMKITVTVRPL
jgi:hypothetical protein